jgi:hypothetical protein
MLAEGFPPVLAEIDDNGPSTNYAAIATPLVD